LLFAPQGDPYKTLIVARLSFDVTEKKLRREFEEFGPIKRIRLVTDSSGEDLAMHAGWRHHHDLPRCGAAS
jgi:RNA recognition motif-containing protein